MKKQYLYILPAIYILLYILPLGLRPMMIPDEPRYALVPWEMLNFGDWIVPHIDATRYFEKPVLGYWLNAISMFFFGENAFAVRLPSALSAGFGALLSFLLLRRFGGGQVPAFVGTAILLTSGLFLGIGTYAVLDSMLTVFLTLALFCFFRFYLEEDKKNKRLWLSLFGVACGLAFLTKGFLAFVVPVLVVGAFMIWEGKWTELFKICWLPILTAFLVALPWALAIALREPDYWHYFFWIEHIQRFLAKDAQHPQPIWYFIPVLFAGFMPWTAILPATWSGLKRINTKQAFIRFLICWLLMPFLFFSASRGKLATYILPCFAPLAMLIGISLSSLWTEKRNKLFAGGAVFLGGLLVLIFIGLPLIQIFPILPEKPYVSGEVWKWLLAEAGVAVWIFFLWQVYKADSGQKQFLAFLAGPLLLLGIAPALIPGLVIANKAPAAFMLKHKDWVTPQTILVSDDHQLRDVCWTFKRTDVYLLGGAGEFSYGFNYPKARSRKYRVTEFAEFLRTKPAEQEVVVIGRESRYRKKYSKKFPEPKELAQHGNFVMARY